MDRNPEVENTTFKQSEKCANQLLLRELGHTGGSSVSQWRFDEPKFQSNLELKLSYNGAFKFIYDTSKTQC